MKGFSAWLLAGFLFLAACTDENPAIQDTTLLEGYAGLYSFEAGFVPSEGRTVLQDGGKVSWKAGDKVLLFDKNNYARYVAIADGATTMFVLEEGQKTLDKDGEYTAFYPADKFDATTGKFEVKNVQTAIAGTFDADAAVCIGTLTDNGFVKFNNLCSLMKMNIPLAAIDAGIRTVEMTVPSNLVSGGTILADGSIDWNLKEQSFCLSGNFLYGEDYYLMVPAQHLMDGFTVSLKNAQGELIENCQRNKLSSVEVLESKMYDWGCIYEIEPDFEWYTKVLEENPEADEFIISKPEEFVGFVKLMNDGQPFVHGRSSGLEEFVPVKYMLGADIDMLYHSDAIEPVREFVGCFDGQGHTIKNLRIRSAEQYVGLFAEVRNSETAPSFVKNLTLEGGGIVSTGTDEYVDYGVGAIAGKAVDTSFENCHNDNCRVMHSGPGAVGGITGSPEYCHFIACSNSGRIISQAKTNKCVYLGGITNTASSYNEIVACYNVGTIEGLGKNVYAGGITGNLMERSSVVACFNAGKLSDCTYAGAIVGLADAGSHIICSYYENELGFCGLDKGAGKGEVGRMNYREAVSNLNRGIMLDYNRGEHPFPCDYIFVSGNYPILILAGNGAIWDVEEY